MNALVQPAMLGDVLFYEAPNHYSREQVGVAPNQTLVIGTVLGKLTATSQIAALNPAAAEGSERTADIVLVDITTTADARTDGLILARLGLVASHALVWPAAITDAQKAIAIAQLEVLGIVSRESA